MSNLSKNIISIDGPKNDLEALVANMGGGNYPVEPTSGLGKEMQKLDGGNGGLPPYTSEDVGKVLGVEEHTETKTVALVKHVDINLNVQPAPIPSHSASVEITEGMLITLYGIINEHSHGELCDMADEVVEVGRNSLTGKLGFGYQFTYVIEGKLPVTISCILEVNLEDWTVSFYKEGQIYTIQDLDLLNFSMYTNVEEAKIAPEWREEKDNGSGGVFVVHVDNDTLDKKMCEIREAWDRGDKIEIVQGNVHRVAITFIDVHYEERADPPGYIGSVGTMDMEITSNTPNYLLYSVRGASEADALNAYPRYFE